MLCRVVFYFVFFRTLFIYDFIFKFLSSYFYFSFYIFLSIVLLFIGLKAHAFGLKIRPRSAQDDAHRSRPKAQAATGPDAKRKAGPGMLACYPGSLLSPCCAVRPGLAPVFFLACSKGQPPLMRWSSSSPAVDPCHRPLAC